MHYASHFFFPPVQLFTCQAILQYSICIPLIYLLIFYSLMYFYKGKHEHNLSCQSAQKLTFWVGLNIQTAPALIAS